MITTSRDASLFSEILAGADIISDRATIDQRYGRNVTALSREIPLVLRPHTVEQVARIVWVANEAHLALYPFSTGRNWGLGSKLPVRDNCILVDLGQMTSIIEVDDEFGYCIIEPGVTQVQLANYLGIHHPTLTLNFTGTFGYTSIVGNTLERGDGFTARIDDLLGVQGILGNGTPFSAGGIWRQVGTKQPSHHTKYIAGPDLTGLFSQSSFGIVTRMAFRLIHKPERSFVCWGIVEPENLDALACEFRYFGQQRMINPQSSQIGYANRFVQARSTLANSEPEHGAGRWHFYILTSGQATVAATIVETVRSRLQPLCVEIGTFCYETSTDPYGELPEFLHPLTKQFSGMPDTESIKLIYDLTATTVPDNPTDIDADQTPFGMKCFVGMIPFGAPYLRQTVDIVAQVRKEFGLNIKPSIYGDGRVLITVHFDRRDEGQSTRAQRSEVALWDGMTAAGFLPYRAGIDQMERLVALQPEFFEVVDQIKVALDPNRVMSPGRYGRG